ncbi:amidase domain-containing protein [Clostridium septicum]|uniref:Amidase domain-containing protein n=1 Tax=Clostridium septicum TaxID=1504 RepID=A0ABY5B6V6_CLOSE|nr:amidase domain-containing protein [Clostridium septicum]MDU1314562.1 amidase domain-containing protein [Clostridium septicum]UEC19829.1 amidase domain-containing protein [Clostridium septicum]USS02111.1 amidase domain-containing protein [Clostridium septicum]WLF70687.1 amidase domain-containing protein [Clostridium septicum]
MAKKFKLLPFLILITLISSPVSKVIAYTEKESSSFTKDEIKTLESSSGTGTSEKVKAEFKGLLEKLFSERNEAVVCGDCELLKNFYDLNIKVSLWAYESEAKKTQYLINWSEKQYVQFKDLKSNVKIRKVVEKEPGLFGIICDVATDFNYYYLDSPDVINHFRLGTNHYINLKKNGDKYIITKEWYTDPFADSLDMDNIKSDEIKDYIISRNAPEFNPNERLQNAINYAHKYCGVSEDEEFTFKYNSKYKNHNPDGGDCANFASQILHEGGNFKKNGAWNYDGKDGTKAWLNAQGFKNYMLGSGRASYIAKGNYNKVYKAAFNMRPGDFVAYEKKGRITHISTVTGFDSKGYPLVTCHNTDRLLVPYDLGWSNSNIKFHLIHVHY